MLDLFSLVLIGVCAFSTVAIVILGWLVWRLNKKISLLLMGRKAADLEDIILEHGRLLKESDRDIQLLFDGMNAVNRTALRGFHKTGFVRFNPFKDMGGNQSFALALLDGRDAGIILSSLHTREGTRTYAKEIAPGAIPQTPLSDEEKNVLAAAQQSFTPSSPSHK